MSKAPSGGFFYAKTARIRIILVEWSYCCSIKNMTVAIPSDYFGTELAGLISTNAAAIGANLSLNSVQVTDPDKLLAAIVKKTKAWLAANDATTEENGTTIAGFGTNGASSLTLGSGNRAGQIGYQDTITFYVPDLNSSVLDPAEVL